MKRSNSIGIILTCIFLSMGVVCLLTENLPLVKAKTIYQTTPLSFSTPTPILGPIYYGRWDVLNVFDHNLPLANLLGDGNELSLNCTLGGMASL